MYALSFAVVAALASLGLASATPIQSRQSDPTYPYPQVKFTNEFPTQICSEYGYKFEWTGGSGYYNLVEILNYPGLPDTHPGIIQRNVTETCYESIAPGIHSLPANSTFQFSIEESNAPVDGSSLWYDLSPVIPVKECP